MEPQGQSTSAHDGGGGGGNTLREGILLQPDGYVDSVEKRWVHDDGGCFMTQLAVTYLPALCRIFDEVLVHAADNKRRDPAMGTLRVEVDVAKCRISIYNDGVGTPIEVHPEEGVYVPEVIFGHLGNRDHDAEDEIAGGRNGYGVKLANIFSKEFIVVFGCTYAIA